MNRQLFSILKHIQGQAYVTAEEIAAKEKLSTKTVRLRIRELEEELAGKGAYLDIKRGQGYRIVITEPRKYELWRSEKAENIDSKSPENSDERQEHILLLLLNCKDYIKRVELADHLHISEKSISQDLKQIERFLEKYNLRIEKTPFYGMKLNGNEYAKRQCLSELVLNAHDRTWVPQRNYSLQKKLGRTIQATLDEFHIQIPEMSFACLAVYMEVLIQRTKQGFFIENFNVNSEEIANEMRIAHSLVQKLQEDMGVMGLNIYEEQAICIVLCSSRITGENYKRSIEISPQLDSLVKAMLQGVKERFGLDFSKHFELWVLLNHHMEYLDTRMRYYIPLKNPILNEIMEQYMLAYAIAEQAVIPLSQFYKRSIPEDEIGYFALLFQVALEQEGKNLQTQSVLLVCVTGKISSKFLETRLRQEFGSNLNNIVSCDVHDLKEMDYTNIEYVLTTIPIPDPLPVPVIRIKEFLDHTELDNLRQAIDEQLINFIRRYYSEDLFFRGIQGNNKEEVLKEICRRLALLRELPADFYEQVMLREKYGSTDYRRLVAIPHPYQVCLKENVVCVAVLDKPVLWGKNDVQLIVLAAIADTANAATQRFFDITMKTLMNEKAVRKVIEDKTWSSWAGILAENA